MRDAGNQLNYSMRIGDQKGFVTLKTKKYSPTKIIIINIYAKTKD